MITIWTQAYNTEKYIRKCIQSVLNQTFRDFEYIIVDNGSTDNTGKIIDEFAARDNRVRVFRLNENYRGVIYSILLDNIRGEYFTALDSDDWLEPNFLEKLYKFSQKNNLDMCVTGSYYYMEKYRKVGVLRKPNHDLVFTRNEIPNCFAFVHVFLRTIWGKLIKTESIFKADLYLFKNLSDNQCNGADTAFSVSIFENCDRIGMLSDVLHYYRVRNGSVFKEYHNKRFYSYEKLYIQTINLLSKFGEISKENIRFTSLVFFNSIKDTFDICINSSLPMNKKKEAMFEILGSSTLIKVRKDNDDNNDGLNILGRYINWLIKSNVNLSYNDYTLIIYFVFPQYVGVIRDEDIDILIQDADIIYDIISRNFVKAYERIVKINKHTQSSTLIKLELHCLKEAAFNDRDLLENCIEYANKYPEYRNDVKEYILRILYKNKLISVINIDDAVFDLLNVLNAIYSGKYSCAIDLAYNIIQNDNKSKFKLQLSELMKYVSAKANDASAYVYFYKVYCVELLLANELMKASESINELYGLVPDDKDVLELKRYLNIP